MALPTPPRAAHPPLTSRPSSASRRRVLAGLLEPLSHDERDYTLELNRHPPTVVAQVSPSRHPKLLALATVPSTSAQVSPSHEANFKYAHRVRRAPTQPDVIPRVVKNICEGRVSALAVVDPPSDASLHNRFEDVIPSPVRNPSPMRSPEHAATREVMARRVIAKAEMLERATLRLQLEAGCRSKGPSSAAYYASSMENSSRNSIAFAEESLRESIHASFVSFAKRLRDREALLAFVHVEKTHRAGVQQEELADRDFMRATHQLLQQRAADGDLALRRFVALHASGALEREYMQTPLGSFAIGFLRGDAVRCYNELFVSLHADFWSAEIRSMAERWLPYSQRLAITAAESCSRILIVQDEGADFRQGVLRAVDAAYDEEAQFMKQFHMEQQRTLTSFADYSARHLLQRDEEKERLRLVSSSDRDVGILDLLRQQEGSRLLIVGNEEVQRKQCLVAWYHVQGASLAGRFTQLETRSRIDIELDERRARREAGKTWGAEFEGLLLVAEVKSRESLVLEYEGDSRTLTVVGQVLVTEDGFRQQIEAEERTERAVHFKAFRYQRMNIIADEANDYLPQKALAYVVEVEEDDRRLHKKIEAREREVLAPLWLCLSGYLGQRAALEAQHAVWVKSVAFMQEERHARCRMTTDEVRARRVIDQIGGSGDVPASTYIACHSLVPAGMAIAWLDLLDG